MQFFTSLLFAAFISLWSAAIPIFFLPFCLIFNSSKIADFGAKIWAIVLLWALKKLCHIDFKVFGKSNIPKAPCIIACKHQSMWETVIMHLILHRPVYLYKQELRKVPFYGWFLLKMSGVAVDRKGGMKSLKKVIAHSKKYLGQGQTIVIFPQGTRVPCGESIEKYPYQAGITALYNGCEVDVIPAALNSGFFWPKNSLLKKPGTITIEFLPAIKPGKSKAEFNSELVTVIESACDRLSHPQF